jgi:transposase InsO family protein
MTFAVPNHTAYTVADTLITQVFRQYGFPTQIHTDQGREFESHLFSEICKLLGVDKTRTCLYNPKSDGMIERNNRTILQMLTHFFSVEQNQKDWDDHLCYIMAAYRATKHSSTGCSPNLLMLGHEVDNPIDVMVGPPPGQPEN